MPDASEAAKIKDEGNKLFASKNYSQAYDKYSKALRVGGDNAVLYANRSACLLSLGRKVEAVEDAKKATNLDPSYIKGWGRLGAAAAELEAWEDSQKAYETAISILPESGLSPAAKAQKASYENAIGLAKKKQEPQPVRNVHILSHSRGKKCWQSARDFLVTVKSEGRDQEVVNSSALVINAAANDFKGAKEGHAHLREVNVGGRKAYSGATQVVADYCNAILTDRRAFHIDDNKWLSMYNKQVEMEVSKWQCGGWTNKSVDYILHEAIQQVHTRGWSRSRPALAVHIRGWIVRGYLGGGFSQDYTTAVELYEKAIDAIRKGRELFAGVDQDDRGTTFNRTFLFGVESIQLEAFINAYAKTGGRDSRFTIAKLEELANGLYTDVESARAELSTWEMNTLGPETYMAFYIYPAGEALCAQAFARKMRAQETIGEDSKRLWEESGDLYWRAAEKIPKDDEKHCGWISNALGSYWIKGDVPLRKTLPLLKRLEEDTPQMQLIWQNSAFALEGRDALIGQCLGFHREIKNKLKDGTITEASVYNPPFTI